MWSNWCELCFEQGSDHVTSGGQCQPELFCDFVNLIFSYFISPAFCFFFPLLPYRVLVKLLVLLILLVEVFSAWSVLWPCQAMFSLLIPYPRPYLKLLGRSITSKEMSDRYSFWKSIELILGWLLGCSAPLTFTAIIPMKKIWVYS